MLHAHTCTEIASSSRRVRLAHVMICRSIIHDVLLSPSLPLSAFSLNQEYLEDEVLLEMPSLTVMFTAF